VFDKTCTLTTGRFEISGFYTNLSNDEFKRIVYSIEKYSNHPLASAISRNWKVKDEIRWKSTEEIKGRGMRVVSREGDVYEAGSFRIVAGLNIEQGHQVYVTKNGQLIGWIDLQDHIREEAVDVIKYLKSKNIKTILLSGDRKETCEAVATKLGIDEVISEQSPQQKLEKVSALTASAPTIMIGDGINDAPALARATIGISLSEASQVAMQTADVVLMSSGLKNLTLSLGIGRHTYLTIKQNLFWAFIYNIIAIPVAALGFLSPTFGALVMGLSDVVLAANSVRLFVKKVN
jgi:Cu+-exporting ATPase